MASSCRVVVMASGNGSNFQALIDAVREGSILNTQIVRLFVNRKTAFAIQRATKAGIPSEYFNMVKDGFVTAGEKDAEKLKEGRARYDAALAEKVLEEKPDLVVLAGWMHVFSVPFLRPLEEKGVKIINLHPALPGQYDGAGAIERAFQDFQEGKLENNRTGIMVHYVIAQVDRGDPILTQEIECQKGDTLEKLEERIHGAEHEIIVKATAMVVGEVLARKHL